MVLSLLPLSVAGRVRERFWRGLAGVALCLPLSLGLPGQAAAATYEYSFELTLTAEVVNATQARGPDGTHTQIDAWVDPADIGASDQLRTLTPRPGETAAGRLSFSDPRAFALEIDGIFATASHAWMLAQDAGSGDAALAFSTHYSQYTFDFIDGVATYRDDWSGSLTGDDGSVFAYHGYRAEFALAQVDPTRSQPIAVMPLPAGPALLMAALAALAACRAWRRPA